MTNSKTESGNIVIPDARTQKLVERMMITQKQLDSLTKQGPAPRTVWSTFPEKEYEYFGPLVLMLKPKDSCIEEWSVVGISQKRPSKRKAQIQLDRRNSGLHFNCLVNCDQVYAIRREILRSCAGALCENSWQRVMRMIAELSPAKEELKAATSRLISDRE